jgi:ubiquitin C-terminal hydrolase
MWFISELGVGYDCFLRLAGIDNFKNFRDIFSLQSVQITTCQNGHSSSKILNDPVLFLRVDENSYHQGLNLLIQNYFENLIMNSQDDNKYDCATCGREKVRATQTLKIDRLPKLLIIVLNRFKYEVLPISYYIIL